MNRWNIPEYLEDEIRARDTRCVYCGTVFVAGDVSRKTMPTWEHIVNDARIVTRQNVARCCASCNASKGTKDLSEWLKSAYCARNGITVDTVAQVVRKALLNPPQLRAPDA